MKVLAHSNVLVCGTARNVSTKIEKFVQTFDRSFHDCLSLQFLICESFSTDDTARILDDLKRRKNNFDWFHDSEIQKSEKRRTVRIASARNQIMSRVESEYKDIDFVVMADLDGVNRDLTAKAVRSCWDLDAWDMVSANQAWKYYDIWALRAGGWVEIDCWLEYRNLISSIGEKMARRLAVTSKMRRIPRSAKPIEVKSAFGGLAIYSRDAFLEGKYEGSDSAGNEICEHVPFHEMLYSNNRTLLINPKLVNLNEVSQFRNILKEATLKFLAYLHIPASS